VDPCAANKKKACLRLDTCEWAGKKGGGCRTPANVCSGIQKKKLGGVKKKKRCGDNPACRCSKKRKCGQCVANVGVGAPTPNDDERYIGICRGTTKDPDDKKPVCCKTDIDCDNAFQVPGETWQCVGCSSGASTPVTHPDGTTAQVQCTGLPANTPPPICAAPRPPPQDPLPTPPSAADYPMFKGAFYIANKDATGTDACSTQVMAYQPPQGPGICFQGATTYENNACCNPPGGWIFAGTSPTLARGFKRDADPKWYNIGGGGGGEASQVGCTGLQTYSSEKFNDLKKAGYSGIYYDVEAFAADATKECFAESFSNAKQAGLQVMLGTSYSAPYTSALPGDVAQGNNPKAYRPNSDKLFREIMQDQNIDVLSPQFYSQNGVRASIVSSSGSEVKLMDWDTLSGDKPVEPTLKLASLDYYRTQKTQFEAACAGTPQTDPGTNPPTKDEEVPAKFCKSGYWIWGAP
jgi:hypothetical protein